MDHAPGRRAWGKMTHVIGYFASASRPGQAPGRIDPLLGALPPDSGPPARNSADHGPAHGASPPSNRSGKLRRANAKSSTSRAS